MKKYSKLNEVRFSQITPRGWLKTTLECERDGMSGHLDEIGYPYNLPCWQLKSLADGGFAKWWPYEQTGYWIDSMTRTALLLRDEKFLQKAKDIIDTSLEQAEKDGFIGPEELQAAGSRCQWPHAVYFRALYALWSGTGERKYLEAMRRHYLLEYNTYNIDRDAVNIETILRVAEELGDEELVEKARKNYWELQNQERRAEIDYCTAKMVTDIPTGIHGVTLNEVGKLPAIYYTYFGGDDQLAAVKHFYEKIHKDHVFADGVHSSSEATCGKDCLKVHESCDISDYTWSLGYLFAATGDGLYADRIERAIFNAAPGAIGPYFKTIQYFSGVNQVRAARNSTHAEAFQNTPRMAYQPHHYPECCVGNIGRAFPNYVARMYWEEENGIAAVLYGDSEYVGQGMKIVQTGGYPFGDTITFTIHCDQPTAKTLKFRIPGWCKGASLAYNDMKQSVAPVKGFVALEKKFADGDVITLTLPMEFSSETSVEDGVYFNYGPFLLALKIEENWSIDPNEPRQTREFPSYNVEPGEESQWNFAVTGDETPEIVFHTVGAHPWWDSYPFEVRIPAREVEGWTTVKKDAVGRKTEGEGIDAKQIALGATEITEALEQTPPLPDADYIQSHLGEEKMVTLVPYGCTHLRLTVFPKYKK